MINYFVYAGLGRLLIYLFQSNGITTAFKERYTNEDDLLREFVECDLCIGFWVYLILAIFLKSSLTVGLWPKFVENIVLAGFTTLLVHLIRLGWNSKFAIIQYN